MKRTKRNTYLWQLLATLLLLVTPGMFSACSSDDTNTTPANTPDSEIRFDVGVWNMMEGTRATFYDDARLRSEGFICTAYNAGTTTEYISPVQVNWDGGSSQWVWSDGKRYWPAEGSLDFVAYKPNVTSYASVPSYNGTAPSFTATLPMTAAEQDGITELILAFTPNQSKAANAAGVSLNFLHPFARIYFQWASYDHSDITLHSITFKNIKNNGTCSFDGTSSSWSPSDNAIDFTSSDMGGPFLIIPQTFGGIIEVNATWIDWGEPYEHTVTASVPTTWLAGYSYTYTFTITPTDLIVDTEKFTEQW